jgi:flagellar hook-length control protein FliK
LTIHLNPVDFGPISVTAEIRNGEVHVHLAGATDAGREALRAALPDLRKELQQSGLNTLSMDSGREDPRPGGTPDREARQQQTGTRGDDTGRREREPQTRAQHAENATRANGPSNGNGLDLRV